MQSDKTEKCKPTGNTGDGSEPQLLPAREALRRDLKSFEVPAGTDLMLSPYESELAPYFARVEVKTFDDLRVLGFVPRGLAEDKVRNAIAMDQEEAYKVASARAANAPVPASDCSCHNSPATVGARGNLRQYYAAARQRFNPTLARVLGEHLQTRVEWDSPVAGIVRSWMTHIEVATRSPISIALFSDITIDRGATLRIDKTTKALYAGTIYIHRTGKLISEGGYLKIWAHAISNLSTLVTSVTAFNDIPWLANIK